MDWIQLLHSRVSFVISLMCILFCKCSFALLTIVADVCTTCCNTHFVTWCIYAFCVDLGKQSLARLLTDSGMCLLCGRNWVLNWFSLVSVVKPETARFVRRFRLGWEDDIKMGVKYLGLMGEDWIYVAGVWDRWRGLCEHGNESSGYATEGWGGGVLDQLRSGFWTRRLVNEVKFIPVSDISR